MAVSETSDRHSTISVKGRTAAGTPATPGTQLQSLLMDLSFGAFLGSSLVSALTHPYSPLSAFFRPLAHDLTLPDHSLTLRAALTGAWVVALLPRLNGGIPSIGRSFLGIKNGATLAGGNSNERKIASFLCSLAFLGVSLVHMEFLSIQAYSPSLLPVLKLAEDPKLSADINWSELPFYQLAGRWPVRVAEPNHTEEIARVGLGYAPGIIPSRYLPSVTFEWEQSGARLRIEGPRTERLISEEIARLVGNGEGSALVDLRICNDSCSELVRSELRKMSALLGSSRVSHLFVQPWQSPLLDGAILGVTTDAGALFRGIARLPNGSIQTLTWSISRDSSTLQKENTTPPALVRLLGNIGVHPSLAEARAYVNARVEKVNLTELLGAQGGVRELEKLLKSRQGKEEVESRRDALQGIQHLLMAKLTLEPSDPTAFLHLAGTSYLLWKVAIALHDSGTSASSKRVILTAKRYLQDFGAPGNAALQQVEQLLRDMELSESR